MTDLFKAAKNNQWYGPPALTVDAVGGTVKNARIVELISDSNGEPISILTVGYNPATGKLGSLIDSVGTPIAFPSLPTTGGTAQAFPSPYNFGIPVLNFPEFVDVNAADFFSAEEASLVATAYATNTTTAIVASGGASKKYRIFSITGTIETGAAADAVSIGDNAGVNNIYSFTAIGAAVQKQSFRIDFGPNGILQPNAASAISVKASTATAGITGVLTYGAAR